MDPLDHNCPEKHQDIRNHSELLKTSLHQQLGQLKTYMDLLEGQHSAIIYNQMSQVRPLLEKQELLLADISKSNFNVDDLIDKLKEILILSVDSSFHDVVATLSELLDNDSIECDCLILRDQIFNLMEKINKKRTSNDKLISMEKEMIRASINPYSSGDPYTKEGKKKIKLALLDEESSL